MYLIAIGILTDLEKVHPSQLNEIAFIGELSLDGKLNQINGILPMCIEAQKLGIKKIIVPKKNAAEAAIVKEIEVLGADNLKQVVEYLKCTCTPQMISKYMGKISGPLLDRIDIQIEVTPVKYQKLEGEEKTETSGEIKERVDKARGIQIQQAITERPWNTQQANYKQEHMHYREE